MRKHLLGNRLSFAKLKMAGANFLAVRSPDAPKIMIIVGGVLRVELAFEFVGTEFIILQDSLMERVFKDGNVFMMEKFYFSITITRQINFDHIKSII